MKDLLVHEWKAIVLVGFLAALGGSFVYTLVNPLMSERVVDALAQPVESVRPRAPVHVAKR
jgi:hypothetical protein